MIVMGWFNIYAAVYNDEHQEIFDFTQRYGKQFIWIMATIVLAIFIMIVDSRFYLFFAWFIYAITMLLLILVLVLGKDINGARSWIEFGPVSLQNLLNSELHLPWQVFLITAEMILQS